jgi:predicted ATPase
MEEAEVHRVLGEVLWRRPDADIDAAHAAFQTSLHVARAQEAKSYELRAAMSLAQLWQSEGRRREARDLLAPVYAWFTEGFDTRDLIAARELLKTLH